MINFIYIISVCRRNTVAVFLTGRLSDPVEKEISRHRDLKKTSISYYFIYFLLTKNILKL